MDLVPMAMIMAKNATRDHLHSALPDAPVVLEVKRRSRFAAARTVNARTGSPAAGRGRVVRPRLARPRFALARALDRAARFVAPSSGSPDSC